MEDKYEALYLENQMCFPLYACARELVKCYKPYLDPLGLTYTQYLVMLVLWEHEEMNVKDMGTLLHLDSGTLTPLLKKMEQRGILSRTRSVSDERVVLVHLTDEGKALREQAVDIPKKMREETCLCSQESTQLMELLQKLLTGCSKT